MSLTTPDLCVFLAAQVVGEKAALGFHDEVQPLRAVLVKQDCPVRVVRPQRRGQLEPTWQLGIRARAQQGLCRHAGALPCGGRSGTCKCPILKRFSVFDVCTSKVSRMARADQEFGHMSFKQTSLYLNNKPERLHAGFLRSFCTRIQIDFTNSAGSTSSAAAR